MNRRVRGSNVDTAVAQERPPAPHVLATTHVDVDRHDALVATRFGQHLALRPRDEAVAPELYAARRAARIGLEAAAVHRHDGQSVRHGMTALNRLPSA